MPNVTSYQVDITGGPDTTQPISQRAQIILVDGTTAVCSIRFHDPGTAIANDIGPTATSVTVMHLPLSLLGPVLDILRNEKPISLNFFANLARARLATGPEAVGAGDRD